MRFYLPRDAYHDAAGNVGASVDVIIPFNNSSLETPPQPSLLLNYSEIVFSASEGVKVATPVVFGVSATVTGITAIGSTLTGAGLSNNVLAGSNLLRAGFHIQILTMCVNMAVPHMPGERGERVWHKHAFIDRFQHTNI